MIEEIEKMAKQDLCPLVDKLFENRVTADMDIPLGKPLIKIKGEPILREGGSLLITGKRKSRKTALITTMLAACFKKNNDYVEGTIPKKVLWLDLEQPAHNTQEAISQHLKDFEDQIEVFSLRGWSLEEKRALSGQLRSSGKLLEYSIIIWDTVKDLVNSANDIQETNELVAEMMEVMDSTGIAFIAVLHQNKKDEYSTGWLGRTIEEKFELVTSIKLDPDASSKQSIWTFDAARSFTGMTDFFLQRVKDQYELIPKDEYQAYHRKQEIEEYATRITGHYASATKAVEALIAKTGKGKSTCWEIWKEMKTTPAVSVKNDGSIGVLQQKNWSGSGVLESKAKCPF